MTNFDPSAGLNSHAPEVLLGESPAAQRLRLQVARIAPHFRIALLTGESGSGKQAVARHLHNACPAASEPFTPLAIPEILTATIRPACSATIYLSDIETLDPSGQRKLLRVLRTVQGRNRVILATCADVKGMVATGRLQPELFDAISTLELRIPPLRSRLDDLDQIAQSMLTRRSPSASLTPETLHTLRERPWPGNLRELDALCRQLALLARTVRAHDLPHPQISGGRAPAPPARLEDVMRRHVLDVLESCSGNKLRAAELLGISRSTLYRMLEAQPAAAL